MLKADVLDFPSPRLKLPGGIGEAEEPFGDVRFKHEEEHRGRVCRWACHVLAQAVAAQILYPAAGDAQL